MRIDAPPVDGAANERLVTFLAREVLGVPRSAVRVARGERARTKTVDVDLPADEVERRIRAWLAR